MEQPLAVKSKSNEDIMNSLKRVSILAIASLLLVIGIGLLISFKNSQEIPNTSRVEEIEDSQTKTPSEKNAARSVPEIRQTVDVIANSDDHAVPVPRSVIDPQRVSELLSSLNGISKTNNSLIVDQLMSAESACQRLEANGSSSRDSLNSDIRDRLTAFCDADSADIRENLDELFEESGMYSTMKVITDESDYGTDASLADEMIKIIGSTSSDMAMRVALVQVIELVLNKDIGSNLIDLSEFNRLQAEQAAYDASVMFFCRSFGGCDADHVKTLNFCASVGCPADYTTLEQAIYDLRSPRQLSLVNRFLDLIYKARMEAL